MESVCGQADHFQNSSEAKSWTNKVVNNNHHHHHQNNGKSIIIAGDIKVVNIQIKEMWQYNSQTFVDSRDAVVIVVVVVGGREKDIGIIYNGRWAWWRRPFHVNATNLRSC